MDAKLIKTEEGFYITHVPSGWYIGDTNHEKVENFKGEQGLLKLSLKNCQAIENGYDLDDLEKLAQKDIHNLKPINPHPTSFFAGYRRGFQKALELMKHRLLEETEWQVEVLMDICGDKVYAVPEPKLDADGCIILKRK